MTTDGAPEALPSDWELDLLRAYVVFGVIDPDSVDEFGIWGNVEHLIRYWTPDLRRRKALRQLRDPTTKRFIKGRGSLKTKRFMAKVTPGRKPRLGDIIPGRKPGLGDIIPGRKPTLSQIIPGHQPTISDILPGHIKPRLSDLPRLLPRDGVPRLRTYEEWMRHYDKWWRDHNKLPEGDHRGPAPAGNHERWNNMYDDWMGGYRGWYNANIHRWGGEPVEEKPPTAPKDLNPQPTPRHPGVAQGEPPKPAPEPKRRPEEATKILQNAGFDLVSLDTGNTDKPLIYRSDDGYELRRYGGAGTGEPVWWELYDPGGNPLMGGEGDKSTGLGGALQKVEQEREKEKAGGLDEPPVFAQFPSKEFERELGGGSQEVYMSGDGYAVIREKYKDDEPEGAKPWMAVTPDGEILGEFRTPGEAEAALREHRSRQKS